MVDVIQFTCPIFFAEENEGQVVIDIMRMGSLKGTAQVRVYTEDGSGKAGLRYTAFSEVISFGDGESAKSVEVGIIDSDLWAPTLEFKVKMDSPKGCELGKYLKDCRVKVIDNDSFPSSKYKEQVQSGEEGISEISGPGLFVEFWKLIFSNKDIRWRTLLSLLLDEMKNGYMYFILIAKAFLVNVVFNLNSPELHGSQRTALAGMIGVGYMAPMVALHFWDYTKIGLDIQGRVRVWIQESLFRKYLNFSEESRAQVPAARMQTAITQDAGDLAEGYVAVLDMVAMFGKLAISLLFMLNSDPGSLWVLITMPCIMLVFALLRQYIKCPCGKSESGDPASELQQLVAESCRSYSLIAAYAQRPRVNDHFSDIAHRSRESKIPERQTRLNNNYVPKWLGPIFIGIYMTFSAEAVLKGLRISEEGGSADDEGGTISLGVFLATIGVFGDVSDMFSDLYKLLLSISGLMDPLREMTLFFNLPTELGKLKEVNRQRRATTKTLRFEVMQKPEPPPETGLTRTDLIPIKVMDMSFCYDSPAGDDKQGLFQNVNLSIGQGSMVALVGAHGSGKTTFLQLLGQRIFPTEGSIFFPSHLRVLFVCQDPVIMSTLSPLENLTYGLGVDAAKDTDTEYIRAVLNELNMKATLKLLTNASKKVLNRMDSSARARKQSDAEIPVNGANYIQLAEVEESEKKETEDEEVDETKRLICCGGGQEDEEDGENPFPAHWHDRLTYTEKVKMHLARGFIMNPEILILHRPFHHFDVATANTFLHVVATHTKSRGIGLSELDRNKRRPRSVIYVPESVDQAKFADVVWQIDNQNRTVKVVESKFSLRDGFEVG